MPDPGNDGAPLSLSASHLAPLTIASPAQDSAIEITNQSPDLLFLDSAAGTKVITFATGADEPVVGQRLTLNMVARSGGEYRMPIILNSLGVLLVLNGLGEGGGLVYNGTGWVLLMDRAATITS